MPELPELEAIRGVLTSQVVGVPIVTAEVFRPTVLRSPSASELIETLTDNRTRTVAELRNLFEKRGGSMGSAGCVAWMFKKKGYLVVLKRAAPEENILEALVEGGAENYEDRGDHFEIYTALEDFLPLRETFERSKIPVEYARLVFAPANTVALSPASREGRRVQAFIEAIEDHDDVQSVWTNADFGDEDSVEKDSTAA